jgi:hypothetical protein
MDANLTMNKRVLPCAKSLAECGFNKKKRLT